MGSQPQIPGEISGKLEKKVGIWREVWDNGGNLMGSVRKWWEISGKFEKSAGSMIKLSV